MTTKAIAFSHQGENFIGQESPFLLILKKEQPLMASLIEFANAAQLPGATVQGIGALKHVDLGYYDLEKKTYLHNKFEDDLELVSAQGNVSWKDGERFPHVHVVLGQRDGSALGGHLFEGIVAVTAELVITPLQGSPKREMNDEVGLGLICAHV